MIAWKISRRTSSSVINLSPHGLPLQALEWTEGALGGIGDLTIPCFLPDNLTGRRTDRFILVVRPPIRLGRDWSCESRGKKVEKRELIIELLRVSRQQSIELCRSRRQGCRSLAITRADLVELTVRQRYRTFSIRYADGRQQRPCGHQTNNATTHRTLSMISMLFEGILNPSKLASHFSFYDCACVVTIIVSPAKNCLLLRANQGSRQDAEWLQ